MVKDFFDGFGDPTRPRSPQPPPRRPPPPCPRLRWMPSDLGYVAESNAMPGEFFEIALGGIAYFLMEKEAMGITMEESEANHIQIEHMTLKGAQAACQAKEIELWHLMLARQRLEAYRAQMPPRLTSTQPEPPARGVHVYTTKSPPAPGSIQLSISVRRQIASAVLNYLLGEFSAEDWTALQRQH